jgi:[NiFe] hydrogenase diaphorase moiety small subunit
VLLDFNRCILCELCVRASRRGRRRQGRVRDRGHGIDKHLSSTAPSGRLATPRLALPTTWRARMCPVGVILPKRRGFAVPIGQRRYDQQPIPNPGEPPREGAR